MSKKSNHRQTTTRQTTKIPAKPSKRILIGRERGYHGTGFGGLSVGGIVNNKKQFERFLPDVHHLPHTHNLEHNSYSKGQPAWGAHLADDLLKQIEKHGCFMYNELS